MAVSSSWVALEPSLQLSAVLANTGPARSVPPPTKQGPMPSLPADQRRVHCSSKIPVSQVDGREEIPYHYSQGDSAVLLNRRL